MPQKKEILIKLISFLLITGQTHALSQWSFYAKVKDLQV